MILVLAIEHAQLVKDHVKNGYQTDGISRLLKGNQDP